MMDAEKHSLEHLVEAAVIDILCAHVAGVTWLHFEHEEAQLERPYGLVRLDRGAPDDNCYHTSELSIYIVGACDKNFRCIDEAISCAGDLSNSLNQAEGFPHRLPPGLPRRAWHHPEQHVLPKLHRRPLGWLHNHLDHHGTLRSQRSHRL